MNTKIFGMLCGICLVVSLAAEQAPTTILAATSNHFAQAAFIRNGHLWMATNYIQRQLTRKGTVSMLQWSYDGQWIAYLITDPSSEMPERLALHVRNVKTEQDTLINWFSKSSRQIYVAYQNRSLEMWRLASNNLRGYQIAVDF